MNLQSIITQGALDLLMNIYKEEFINMGGYLVNTSLVIFINLNRSNLNLLSLYI